MAAYHPRPFIRTLPSTWALVTPARRCRAQASFYGGKAQGMATLSSRAPKEEGTISSVFTSLTGEAQAALPERFSALKKEMWRDTLVQSWREVLGELEQATERVASKGSEIIPRVSYEDLAKGLTEQQIANIKEVGTVIVKGGVPMGVSILPPLESWDYPYGAHCVRIRTCTGSLGLEAGYQRLCRSKYVASQGYAENTNTPSDLFPTADPVLPGFPADNIQVFELYNSQSQIQARTHPALVETQRFLLSLWHTSDPSTEISLNTPISYFDRLRIRQPGDSKFTLGPHIDGGSVERWEDPGYRACFGKILEGGSSWREHDPFDVSPRIHAQQDLYHASNQCSIFRPWQGWTSLSSTGPNEGTLRVLPLLSLATSYTILRPFFRPRVASSTSLAFEDWEVDTDGTNFPGSGMGKTQELNEMTHPHLRLGKTMVSVPRVEHMRTQGIVMSFTQLKPTIAEPQTPPLCISQQCP